MKSVVMLLFVAAIPATVNAQSSLQIPLQFDFLNPGARSLALGSAFVGLADDATAGFTNPAGLTQLTLPEVSVEVRGRRFETPFLERGRLSGVPSGRGVDTIGSPVFGTSLDASGSLSFLSAVYPRPKWAVTAYRHELVKIDSSFVSQGVFQSQDGGDLRELPQNAVRKMNVTNYGFSGAFKVRQDLSVGAGVSLYTLSGTSTFDRFPTQDLLYGPPDYAIPVATTVQGGKDDVALGASVGALWTVHRNVKIGGVFKQGPDFEFSFAEFGRPIVTGHFRVPRTVSVGTRVQALKALMVVADYTRVGYSRLRNDFVTLQARANGLENQFSVNDGNELHVGAEYLWLESSRTPALRVGVWYDPEHTVQYTPTGSAAADKRLLDERFRVALSEGRASVHFTAGGGVSINRHFEINVGGDLTSRSAVVSTSAVVRF